MFVLLCAATWFLTGVIWLVQLVHYPMFAALDEAGFRSSHAFHARRITWIVGPAILIELALSARLVFVEGGAAAWVGFVSVAVSWAVTGLRMIPLHEHLGAVGRDTAAIASLVRWNWLRTAAWSVRSALLLAAASAAPTHGI